VEPDADEEVGPERHVHQCVDRPAFGGVGPGPAVGGAGAAAAVADGDEPPASPRGPAEDVPAGDFVRAVPDEAVLREHDERPRAADRPGVAAEAEEDAVAERQPAEVLDVLRLVFPRPPRPAVGRGGEDVIAPIATDCDEEPVPAGGRPVRFPLAAGLPVAPGGPVGGG
jgi:hypothetical protein